LEHVDSLRDTPSVRLRAEPRHGTVRNVAVALASLGVVALLIGFVFAAPTPELKLAVGQVVPHPGAAAVVQGRALEPDESGLGGVRIEVLRGGAISGAAVSDGSGRFRVNLTGACGLYEITLGAKWQGSTVRQKARHRLCPGDGLPLDARIVTQGHFLWVPGPR
jgi:hypothetical protein